MIHVLPLTNTTSTSGDYVLEDADSLLSLLPYLYPKIEGIWEITVLDIPIRDLRRILDAAVPEHVVLSIYVDRNDLEVFRMERPNLRVESLSPYEQYLQLFKDISIIFDPKAVSEIYKRIGGNLDLLKKALQDVIDVSNGEKVTIDDVNKVVIGNKRTYASDVMRAFLGMNRVPYRWSIANRFTNELGRSHAYYSLRRYVYGLLDAKDKYLNNQDVPDRFKREVEAIDGFTIDHAYCTFMEYDKPQLLPAVLSILERRNYNVSLHK